MILQIRSLVDFFLPHSTEDWTQSPCLLGKYSYHWAICPAHQWTWYCLISLSAIVPTLYWWSFFSSPVEGAEHSCAWLL
jgi:hypothetical protein